jgi:hypothetical protein
VTLFQTTTQHLYSTTNSLDGLGTFMGFLFGGAAMVVAGSITLLVARIGALIEVAKAQEWVWFVLMIIFGWVILLIYLIAVPKPKLAPPYAAYPYPHTAPGQPWPGYPPQVPGTTPPPAQPWPAHQPPAGQQDVSDKPKEY